MASRLSMNHCPTAIAAVNAVPTAASRPTHRIHAFREFCQLSRQLGMFQQVHSIGVRLPLHYRVVPGKQFRHGARPRAWAVASDIVCQCLAT